MINILKKTGMAAVLSLAVAGSAVADGDANFSGLYLGVEGGYDSTTYNGGKDNSVYIGGLAGYRFQTDGNLVLGIEGTYGKNSYDSFGGFDFSSVDYGGEWSASAVVGLAFGDEGRNLIFGKVGYLDTRRDIIDDDTNAVTNDKDTGLRFGGGYERKVLDNMSLRVSADYAKPNDFYKQFQGKAALILSF